MRPVDHPGGPGRGTDPEPGRYSPCDRGTFSSRRSIPAKARCAWTGQVV